MARFFLPRCRRPGNRFSHSLIIMSYLMRKLPAAQIPGEIAAQAFSIRGLPRDSFSGLRCLGKRIDSEDVEGRRSERCAHIGSRASHPFCPSFAVGVSLSGWSTDHTLGHFVNIFSKIA